MLCQQTWPSMHTQARAQAHARRQAVTRLQVEQVGGNHLDGLRVIRVRKQRCDDGHKGKKDTMHVVSARPPLDVFHALSATVHARNAPFSPAIVCAIVLAAVAAARAGGRSPRGLPDAAPPSAMGTSSPSSAASASTSLSIKSTTSGCVRRVAAAHARAGDASDVGRQVCNE
jgi:hypothetical protein